MESLLRISKVAAKRLARTSCIIASMLCFALLHAAQVHGQQAAHIPIDADWATLIAQEHNVLTGNPSEELQKIDLENLTKRDWKRLRKDQLESVRSQDDAAWRAAATDIIYLTNFYGDMINLQRASLPLLDHYIFDSDENDRVLALAAMHAVGHHDTMARLSQRVRLEGSDRVKRLTAAAVRDYFDGRQGSIEVRSDAVNPGVAAK